MTTNQILGISSHGSILTVTVGCEKNSGLPNNEDKLSFEVVLMLPVGDASCHVEMGSKLVAGRVEG